MTYSKEKTEITACQSSWSKTDHVVKERKLKWLFQLICTRVYEGHVSKTSHLKDVKELWAILVF